MVNSTDSTVKRSWRQKFRQMAGGAEEGLTIIEDGRIVCTNDRVGEIFGYSRADLLRMSDLALAAPEEVAGLTRSREEAREHAVPLQELEFWAVRKDGGRRYVRTRYCMWPAEDRVSRFLVLTSDVTEEKVEQQAPAEYEPRVPQAEMLYDISQTFFAAGDPEEMLRIAAGPAVDTGAHVATLNFVSVDDEGRPEWAETVAAFGGMTAPLGRRFYLPESPQASLFFPDQDKPLLVGDLAELRDELHQEVVRIMTAVDAGAFASIPLMAGDRWQGLLTIAWPEPHQFSVEEGELLGQIGSGLAASVQAHRLREDAEHRAVWSQTAAEVSQAAASVLDPDELLQRVVNLVRERFELYYVGLFLAGQEVEENDGPRAWAVLRMGTGEAGRQMVEEEHKLEIGGVSMIGQCLATQQPRIAMDVGREAARFANPLLPDTRTELALPLISRGQALGALSIQSTQAAAFSAEDIAVLLAMAGQLAIAIDNADMISQAQSRAERERRVRDITERIHRGADAGIIMRVAVEELSQMLGASRGVIRLGTQDQLVAESGTPAPLRE